MLLIYKDEILKEISEKVPKLDKEVVEIILFGSVARGDFSPLSDLDLLIITKDRPRTKKLFSQFAQRLYLKTGVIFSTKYLTPKEFETAIDPFYHTIKDEGKVLWKKV